MNFVDALNELIAIDKLYSDSVKKPFSKLDPQALVRFKEQLSQKQVEAKDRADKLLGEYKDEDSRVLIQQIIQDIQKNYNILDSNTPRLIEYPRHNDANYWGEHYNHSRYECLMSYCKLAYLEEQNGIQEEHALKLSLLFNSPLDALMYIKENSKANATEKAVHDALLFVLPNPSECTFSFWKVKFKTSIKEKDKAFIDLLANAAAIEDEIKQNKNKPERKPYYNLISGKKSQIQKANATFKKLKSRHGRLSDDEKNEYEGLTKELPALQLELFHLSAGMPLSQCDAAILKAADESFKKKTEGAYTFMLEHGLTKNDFGKFIALKRQDDEHHIPDIQINGSQLGYKGVYLKKVNVLDEMEAAEAACFGKLTDCCQSLSGEAGEPCVIHGLTSPYGGFYVIKDEGGHVLGQCWAWRSQSGAIVFDSIEISRKHDAGAVTALFNQLAQEMVENGCTRKVACGGASGISKKFGFLAPNFSEYFVDYNGYCDSKNQRIVVDTTRPYLFLSTNDESRGKAKRFINSVLTTGNLEQSDSFLEMISFMILAGSNDLRTEIREASELKDVDKQVTEMIGNVRIFIDGSPDEKIALLDKKIDEEPYLAKLSGRKNLTPLMLAAKMGRSDLAVKLVEKGANVHDKEFDTGYTALMIAARRGQSDLALKLIEKGANVNLADNSGRTALMYATESGYYELALKLIVKGANLNLADNSGRTTLMYAVQSGHNELALKHIEKGVNLNEKDSQGATALLLAAKMGRSDLAVKLVEKGANVHDKEFDTGYTALMIAARSGQSDLALKLIEKGANLNEKDSRGETAFMIALKKGHSDLSLILIEKGATFNEKSFYGGTAFMVAVKKGYSDLALKLIEKGANLNEKNIRGTTALMFAAKNGDGELALKLLEKGANVHDKDDYQGTALLYAAEKGLSDLALKLLEKGANVHDKSIQERTTLMIAARSGHSDLALKLLEKGANVHDKDVHQWTPFMYAAANGLSDLALKLLEKGANVHDKDLNEMTALLYAAQNGHSDLVLKLLEKGANMDDKDNYGRTVFMIAIQQGQSDLALKLIEKGANLNEKSYYGGTALMFAARSGHRDLALKLLEKGAELNEKDSKGRTALWYATERGHSDLADLMRVKVEKMSDKPQAEIKNPLTPMRDRLIKEEAPSQLDETIDGIKEEFRNKP